MRKRNLLVLILSLVMIFLIPLEVLGHAHRYPTYRPPHHHYSPHSYHHYYYNDALALGLAGLVIGGVMTTVMLQPTYQRVYVNQPSYPVRSFSPPPARVYSYPPEVPAGMCRWERLVLDGYGRTVLDRNGQPVKEYTLGSCQYPPN